jgi:hypothetical protein
MYISLKPLPPKLKFGFRISLLLISYFFRYLSLLLIFLISHCVMATTTEKALEEPQTQHIPHWRLILDHERITPAVSGHKYEGAGTDEAPYIVTWIPNDPGNPMDFAPSKKWFISGIAAVSMLATAFNSSAFSGKEKYSRIR